jgi:hypothetical protein
MTKIKYKNSFRQSLWAWVIINLTQAKHSSIFSTTQVNQLNVVQLVNQLSILHD